MVGVIFHLYGTRRFIIVFDTAQPPVPILTQAECYVHFHVTFLKAFHLRLGLWSDLFPTDFPIKFMYALLIGRH
jgi:hypothetical protein